MRRTGLVVALLVAAATPAIADPLDGRWLVTFDTLGAPSFFTMKLAQARGQLTGDFAGDKLTGTVTNDAVEISAKDESGGFENLKGTVHGGTITGSIEIQFSNQTKPTTHPFTATFVPPRKAKPVRHAFVPTTFYRQFSAANKPVLTIGAGDTIATTTVDAGGNDAKGDPRVLGGNPQTGPFYVEGAVPGDTLVVHVVHLRLNRDYAISDDGLVPRALGPELATKMKDTGKDVRWHLDRAKGLATSEKGEHLASYKVPVHPMLGCIGVAPNPTQAAPPTQDSGSWGGNMDFNGVGEGATVYLPVRNPGALLYFGDGHAAQGDGELNGNALETSLDVEVTVDVIPGKSVPNPRVETATQWIAMGLDGSIDDAFRAATANMAAWLDERYTLTPSEVAQILGTSAQYRVSEVADRNAGVVLAIDKDRLRGLPAH